ncbi:MAG: nicotinamide mononucleotide transporter [Lewinellaceae bacterium]|nr:nicotinamide mononucleotide transporter [Saprospiraceae bacterium]MCB9337479.1 nicotinamide mononucleotide transporter [Lewinellaceae bacterium]
MTIALYIQQFTQQVQSQTWLDWSVTVTALVYVFLAAREKVACWVWGAISCSLWAYADFTAYNLWVDGILQLFYVGMSLWGLYAWRYGNQESKPLAIHVLPFKYHVGIFFLGALLTVALGFIFKQYTPTSYPYPDSFITSFSILATVLTVRKVLENWLYWIVLDTLAVFLFAAKDAILVAMVMVIYSIVAIFGYLQWRRKWRTVQD